MRAPTLALAAILSASVPAACKPGGTQGATLTPGEIAESGTHTFSASGKATFEAMLNALAAEGYEVAVSDEAKGIIVTKRKLVGQRAHAQAAGGSAQAVGFAYSRSYEIQLAAQGDTTQVTAKPRVFENEIDISDKPVWMLDGAAGERALWKQLFDRTAQFLP